jgi:hypothetical protein
MIPYRGDIYAAEGTKGLMTGLTNFLLGASNPTPSGGDSATFADAMKSGAQSVAEGYDKFLEEQKQLNAAGKAGKYYFEANPQALQEMGKTPEEAKNFGAQDWAQLMQAHSTKQTLAQIMARTQLAQDEAAANDFYSKIGAGLVKQINGAPTDPLTEEPMTNNPDTAALISGLSPQQQALIRAIGQAGPGNRGAGQVMVPLVKSLLATPIRTEDNTPKWMKGPNGEDVLFQPATKNSPIISPFSKAAARSQEIEAQGKVTASKGLLPPGTTFETTENGFGIATLPDGTIKSLGRVPTDKKSKLSFFDRLMGGAAAATNAPAATNDYKSADDVKAAFRAGKLDKDSAIKLLKSNFGMQ